MAGTHPGGGTLSRAGSSSGANVVKNSLIRLFLLFLVATLALGNAQAAGGGAAAGAGGGASGTGAASGSAGGPEASSSAAAIGLGNSANAAPPSPGSASSTGPTNPNGGSLGASLAQQEACDPTARAAPRSGSSCW
jgi:hypothetical protein